MSLSNERKYYENPVLWSNSYWSERETLRATQTVAMLPPDVKTVLDVGCGAGVVSRVLKEKCDFVCSADFAFEPLRQVQGNGLNAIQADIAALPFETKSFDAVVVTEVFEHLPSNSIKPAIDEVSRVATGYILLSVPYRESLSERYVRCGNCDRIYHMYHHYHSFVEKVLNSMFLPNFQTARMEFMGNKYKRMPDFLNVISSLSDYKYPVISSSSCPSCGSSECFSNRGSIVNRMIVKMTNHLILLRSFSEWIAILYSACDHGRK